MSTAIVFLVLGAGWCTYLAFWWKDARRESYGRGDAIQTFSRGMGSLGGSAGRSMTRGSLATLDLLPRSSTAAARRRQQVFAVLGAGALASLLGSFVFGPVALLLHVIIDLALISYAYAAVQRRNMAAEREIKVQMLYPEGVTPLHAERRAVNA